MEEFNKAYGGEEGSNVIAMGEDRFISFRGGMIYDKEGLQRHIRDEFDSVKDKNVSLDEFQFEAIHTIRLPRITWRNR